MMLYLSHFSNITSQVSRVFIPILKLHKNNMEVNIMFRWAIIFAVIALVASLFGFGGVAGMSKDFAVILLVVAVILAIVGFISRGKV
jgi:uncharacterized membrane protein YtjA (UPF0391 family)